MVRLGFILLILLSISFNVDACRFTVREIGFSILSQDVYTLAVIDEDANPKDSNWKQLRKTARNSNLRVEVLSPSVDSSHPIILSAIAKGLSFPSHVLVSPRGDMLPFKGVNIDENLKAANNSYFREYLRNSFPEVFAVVVWVEGKTKTENEILERKISEECSAIESIMPNMPKIVKKGPEILKISKVNFEQERVLLWSLGIKEIPDEPVAFVLYGRGRIIGGLLGSEQIQNGDLYQYMSMIGADCECGLDKKWMLGHQIPMIWNKESSQGLTNIVGFDVDNPMILAEMSRILAKEKSEDASTNISFAPETINLDEAFGNTEDESNVKEDQNPKNSLKSTLFYTLISLLLVIIAIAGFLYYKKR